MAGSADINPMGNLYKSFLTILDNMTIKYVVKAEQYETLESQQTADEYLDIINGVDNFFTYIDYSEKDFLTVGITDRNIIDTAMAGNTEVIPVGYRDQLLALRRQRTLDNFEEKNNYYRCLNGYPDIEDTDYFYIPESTANQYGIDHTIPLHKIQDYYNKIKPKSGDYYISIFEGNGFIDQVIQLNPDKEYLKYLGSNRIDLNTSRKSKNFQIIQMKQCNVKQTILDKFMQTYEQCREYFVKVIYIPEFRSFIERYDNFIAMCIMVMTLQQMVMNQISLGVKREYFDIFAVKALYEAYDVPCNLNIDDETQSDIVQNLNILIQNKATNKVIYDIANLLGFPNIKVFKYYLSKERKFDIYGVPVVKTINRFNSETGEVETVPDYKAMYDVYFQKCELKEQDFINSFKEPENHVEYETVTSGDPYWFEDEGLYQKVWESEYNFVESKYLSLGISYSMTDIMFENVLLLKLMMQKSKEIDDVRITLPRISGNTEIPLFDIVILLICLTACKHNILGEIITIPTQVIHVLDYMKNVEETDMLVDTFAFDFDYFNPNNDAGRAHMDKMKELLGEDDYNQFVSYVSILSMENNPTPEEKIATLNAMYNNIKNLHTFLNYQMGSTTDRETYTCLKQMYYAAFYSKELRDCFTITGEMTGIERTAWSYFEFLYFRNPKLYNAVFDFNLQDSYAEYITEHGMSGEEFDLNDYMYLVEEGSIKPNYDKLKGDVVDDVNVKNEKIYYYVNHIISRLEMIISDIKYLYLLNDTATPLEDLLVKLVRFFKSYTVDMIGLDTIFVCDLKSENLIRLFDDIHYMEKTIEPKDFLHMPYDDVVHRFQTWLKRLEDLKLKDKMYYEAYLLIDNMWGIYNSVRLRDELSLSVKLENEDKNNLMDIVKLVESEQVVRDTSGIKMRDGIAKMWYEE